jgi:hypothetical protein
MPVPAKPRKHLEAISTLKVATATKDEATSAARSLLAFAEDPETPPGLRSLAVFYGQELAAPSTQKDTARCEGLMQSAIALAAGND